MGQKKFTDYDAFTETADGDVLLGVDVSDTTQSGAGTTKKLPVSVLATKIREGTTFKEQTDAASAFPSVASGDKLLALDASDSDTAKRLTVGDLASPISESQAMATSHVKRVTDITALRALTGMQDGQVVRLEADGVVGHYKADLSDTTSTEDAPRIYVLTDGTRVKRDDSAPRTEGNRSYRTVGAVIRQDTAGAGWYALDDSNHRPTGFSSVAETAGGDLAVTYSFTSSKRCAMLASPDETFAAAGLTFGASVGPSAATYSLYLPLTMRISGTSVVFHNWNGESSGNVAVDTSLAASEGKITVTHPAQTHSDGNSWPVLWNRYEPGGNADYAMTSVGKSGFTIQALGDFVGKITASGGSPVVTTDLITPPTATWDGVDTLTIDHEILENANDIALTAMADGVFQPVITGTPTAAQFKVKLVRLTDGSIYSGAAYPASGAFQWKRESKRPVPWSSATKIQVQRHIIKCDAADVANSSANIWMHGIFED